MRYLVGQVAAGRTAGTIFHDPPAAPGSVQDALTRVRVASLDLAPMAAAEALRVLGRTAPCVFNRSPEDDPVLWVLPGEGRATAKLNGVLLTLDLAGENRFAAEGLEMTVTPLGAEADWRGDADLVSALAQGPTVGYRGFWTCDA